MLNIYKHKLTGAKLDLIKKYDNIATFFVLDDNLNKTYYRLLGQGVAQKAICKLSNIEKI